MDLDALQLEAERRLDDAEIWWRLGNGLAERAADNGDPNDRIAALAALMHAASLAQTPELEARLASAFGLLGELDIALEQLQRLNGASDGANGAHYDLIVRMLLDAGRTADAFAVLERTNAFVNQHDELRLLRCLVIAARGDVERALTEVEEIVARHPTLLAAHVAKARLLANDQRVEACIAAWEAAVEALPDNLQALTGLGVALASAARYDEASAALTSVARLDPGSAEAYLNLAVVLRTAGHLDDAEWAAKTAQELAPGSAQARYDLGLVHEAAGRTEPALQSFRDAVMRQPNWLRPYLAQARLLERTERFDEAAQIIDQANRLEGLDTEARRELAEALNALRARRLRGLAGGSSR